MLSHGRGFKEKISVACAEREEQNIRKESKDKEGLEVYEMLKEGIGFKDYLHGPMDAGTKLKVKFRTGDISLRDRRRRHRTVDDEDDEFKCDCGFECEDRVHVVAECPLYKKEREVYMTELGIIEGTYGEMFEAWNREGRTAEDLFYNMDTRRRAFKSPGEQYKGILDVVTRYAVHFGDRGVSFTCKKAEDLFYNMDTRRRAFKSPGEQYKGILDVVTRYAVHFGDRGVSFTCKKHGQSGPDLHTPPRSSCLANIQVAFGPALSRELVELECSQAEELLDQGVDGGGAIADVWRFTRLWG
ncbi:unnamed protein product [Ectocarpus sp. CCAP 1310/34]|nr:unnamed protein product [Ectocarpus sp. CCAP 1310/34]